MGFKVKKANPEVLKWARKKMNLSLEVVQKKVKAIEAIEAGQKLPTYKQLETLSKLYVQPLFFFLQEAVPREETLFSPEFRNLLGSKNELSYELRRLIRTIEEHRKIFLDLKTIAPFRPPQNQINLRTSTSRLANAVREWLGISLDEQLSWPGNQLNPEKNSFYFWREHLEKKGVLILVSGFQGKWRVEVEEMRGFCLRYETLPVIVINGKDKINGKVFTLMHELGHLLLGEENVDQDFDQVSHPQEVFCNRFAADLLVPQNAFLKRIDPTINYARLSVKELDQYARNMAQQFGVSTEVIVRRLMDTEKVSQRIYRKYREFQKEQWEKQQRKQRESKGGPRRNMPKECLERFGKQYIQGILNAYETQEIPINKAARFLDMKVKYLDELEFQLGEA